MIEQGYRMRPLYEAMSVCSYTIEWLEQTERERSDFELQVNLANLSRVLEEFIERVVKNNPLREAPQNVVTGFSFCVETLNCMTQLISARTREILPQVCDKLREPITLLLDQVDSLASRIEEMLEAWQVPLDAELSAKIDSALEQIDKTKTDIPDWRKTLELVSD